jgi:hypothetical protein
LQKYESCKFDEATTAADIIQRYESRLAALERLVGKQALELVFHKGELKSGLTSVITGPLGFGLITSS